jgi:DNA-binding CsgD family transcriptional regulator
MTSAVQQPDPLLDVWTRLTPRQKEVLRLWVRGFSTKESAKALNLGPCTVAAYRRQLRFQYGTSRASAILYRGRLAMEHQGEQLEYVLHDPPPSPAE